MGVWKEDGGLGRIKSDLGVGGQVGGLWSCVLVRSKFRGLNGRCYGHPTSLHQASTLQSHFCFRRGWGNGPSKVLAAAFSPLFWLCRCLLFMWLFSKIPRFSLKCHWLCNHFLVAVRYIKQAKQIDHRQTRASQMLWWAPYAVQVTGLWHTCFLSGSRGRHLDGKWFWNCGAGKTFHKWIFWPTLAVLTPYSLPLCKQTLRTDTNSVATLPKGAVKDKQAVKMKVEFFRQAFQGCSLPRLCLV